MPEDKTGYDKFKKIVRVGFAQAIDGNTILVNTTTDEMVSITIKDKEVLWAMYCNHVKITIESITKEEVDKALKML